MPSNKILSTLILCGGVIISIFLINKKSALPIANTKNDSAIKAVDGTMLKNEPKNDDWKKLFLSVDKNPVTTVLGQETAEVSYETTLTDQLSKDFLSQYLLAIKNGPVTSSVANQIAQKVLLTPEYTKISAPKYLITNLNITKDIDKNTIIIYKEKINLSLKNVYFGIKTNPVLLINKAIKNESDDELKGLDPIISINKELIKDLLEMKVPLSAANTHLALLNSSSEILSDLEAIRTLISDPVKSLPAISQYPKHIIDFQNALKNMDYYLSQNT